VTLPVGFVAQKQAGNAAEAAALCSLLHISGLWQSWWLRPWGAAGQSSMLKEACGT